MNENRKYVAISIKHTEHRWKYGKPCVLWGYYQTKDDEPRCFSNYTMYLNKAERYDIDDFKRHGYSEPTIKMEPVSITPDLCKKNKKYDTVLVSYKEYKKYCDACMLATDAPREE